MALVDIPYLIKKEGLRRGLSRRTIYTYSECVERFFRKYHKEPKRITKKDIREFLDQFIEKKYAGNTINVYLNALKFFFEEVMGKRMRLNIKYSKVPKTLPVVLTQEETSRLFRAINNQKHRFMIEFMYSAGLRVNELISLKVKDLEIENNYGWVRKGKGNKDRLFIIAKLLKPKLKDHIKDLNVDDWVFKGRNGHITSRTIQMLINKAREGAKINKKIHPHTLRHSFATHLIENGYDVASVQSLLGHSSSETTMVYLHMASPRMINVESPLDSLH